MIPMHDFPTTWEQRPSFQAKKNVLNPMEMEMHVHIYSWVSDCASNSNEAQLKDPFTIVKNK